MDRDLNYLETIKHIKCTTFITNIQGLLLSYSRPCMSAWPLPLRRGYSNVLYFYGPVNNTFPQCKPLFQFISSQELHQ